MTLPAPKMPYRSNARNRLKDLAVVVLAAIVFSFLVDWALGQCVGGDCYPWQRQPAPARWVLPTWPPQSPVTSHQSPLAHAAHCRIQVADGTTGSGTLVAKDHQTALVLTCSHLFDTSTANIVVTFPSGDRYGARLVDRDRGQDLAALLIRTPREQPLAVDDSDPVGVLTACGYGGDGRFSPARGPITGAAQAIGASYPSLKIGAAVRPGDSGGGVLNTSGRFVGVVWGCRDGETYLTAGEPLRNFLGRLRGVGGWQHQTTEVTPINNPSAAAAACRCDERFGVVAGRIDTATGRIDQVDAAVGELRGRLDALANRSPQTSPAAPPATPTTAAPPTAAPPTTVGGGFLAGLAGAPWLKILAGAAAIGGGVGLPAAGIYAAKIGLSWAAGSFVRRRVAKRVSGRVRHRVTRRPPPAGTVIPVAVDTPPPPPVMATERHYVPYEQDSFRAAHNWAAEQIVRKFPGATDVITNLDSLIQQQLAGQPTKG